jgi:hypothetical protein
MWRKSTRTVKMKKGAEIRALSADKGSELKIMLR